ncbi:unnamed protein product [Cylicostephanus goldi]|uniref:Uncharacterized protein n=1 Tax=Cylicostephanus goldi TaxID=71465 RepID=A0A3P7Q2H8_CYLGO|nr:unnamed protein product [Cylicostephanus goldi]
MPFIEILGVITQEIVNMFGCELPEGKAAIGPIKVTRRVRNFDLNSCVQQISEKDTHQKYKMSDRLNSRVKSERRRIVELEDDLGSANSKCRELSRQLRDANEANDALTRETNSLRARAAVAGDRRFMSLRDMRRIGSIDLLTRGNGV